MQIRTFDVDRARLSARVHGQGPLAVLLHGYPLDNRMWLDALHGPLATQRTLVALDLRGHGESPWAGDPVHAMELLAGDVAAVIDSLGGPVDVVGLSMGGYVALALWAIAPRAIRSLVLANTRAGADNDAQKAARSAAMDTAVKSGRGAIAAAMLPKLLARDADLLLHARLLSMIEGTPVETIVADLRGLRDRPDRTALLPKISVPTLVVVGDQDAITPVAEATVLANGIPGARLAVLAGAGHMTPMEQPQAFAAAIGGFWQQMH